MKATSNLLIVESYEPFHGLYSRTARDLGFRGSIVCVSDSIKAQAWISEVIEAKLEIGIITSQQLAGLSGSELMAWSIENGYQGRFVLASAMPGDITVTPEVENRLHRHKKNEQPLHVWMRDALHWLFPEPETE